MSKEVKEYKNNLARLRANAPKSKFLEAKIKNKSNSSKKGKLVGTIQQKKQSKSKIKNSFKTQISKIFNN